MPALLVHVYTASTRFTQLFQPYCAPDHIATDRDLTNLTLDTVSGCGFRSKRRYLFGKVSAQIKLVPGDSAGTVTAFYMYSIEGPTHNELDYAFLGNVFGESYLVQINIYINGSGNREQRHSLWFDPTADFHTYSFFWNRQSIITKACSISKNTIYGIYGSLWNADDWATQGGKVKTNWSHSPFISTVRSSEIDGCELTPETDDAASKCGKSGQFWWDKPTMNKLNRAQMKQLRWVRTNYLVYDYCQDCARFPEMPIECGVH